MCAWYMRPVYLCPMWRYRSRRMRPMTEREEIREEIVGAMFFLFAGLVMGIPLGMLIAKAVFA